MSRPRKFSTSELADLVNEYTKQYGLCKLKYVDIVQFGLLKQMDRLTIDDLRKNPEIREYIKTRNDTVNNNIIQTRSLGELVGIDMDISGIAKLCSDPQSTLKILTRIDSSLQGLKKQYNTLLDAMNENFKSRTEMEKEINELKDNLEEFKNENTNLKHINATLKAKIQDAKRDESLALQYINKYMINNIVRAHLIELGAVSFENGTGENDLPEEFEDVFIKQGDDIQLIVKKCIKQKIEAEPSVWKELNDNNIDDDIAKRKKQENVIDINLIKNRIRGI